MGSLWQLFLIWLLVQGGKTMLNFDKCDETTGSCYALVNEQKTWENASKHCSGNGGFLVEIKNRSEQSVVRDIVRDVAIRSSVWLGGTNDYTSEKVLRRPSTQEYYTQQAPTIGIWHWNHTNAPIGNPDNSSIQNPDPNATISYTEGYQSWAPSEPSSAFLTFENKDFENKHCMLMNVSENQIENWKDAKCDEVLDFVCQAPFEPDIPNEPDRPGMPLRANFTDCSNGTLIDGECDYCSPNQCVGGKCISKQRDESNRSGFVCECEKGYAGPLCKLEDDPCINDPSAVCQNGGTCHVKVQPGANDWICLCPWKPQLGQAKDCSKAGASEYPIDKVVMRVLVTVPYAALAVAWIVIAVVECMEVGELPDLEWASDSSSSESEDSIECDIDQPSVNNESSRNNEIITVYSEVSISEINIEEGIQQSHAAIGESKSNISDWKNVSDAQSTLQMNNKPSSLRYEESNLEVSETRSSKFKSSKMLD